MKSPSELNILVVGPGALGTYFAARLGQKLPRLWVLDHKAGRAEELQERGFHVNGATMVDWTPPEGRVGLSPKPWPKMDVIFLMVKAPAVKKAAATAAPAAAPSGVLVLLQNGWGAEAQLGKPWPARRVVRGVTLEAVTLETTGRAFHAAAGATFLDAGSPAARTAAHVMGLAGLKAKLEKDFEKLRWTKLLVSACVNPLGALADVPNGRLMEPPLAPLLDMVLAECQRLSAALGRRIPAEELRRHVREVVQATAANRNSMNQDLARGRATERGFILGPLLDAARRKRVPAPTLQMLDRLLARVEKIA